MNLFGFPPMKKIFQCFLFTFYLTQSKLIAQEVIKYDVTIAGISIGEMVATKTKKGEETFYEIKSHVSFWFFGKISLDYLTHSQYKGKQFIKSEVNSKTNKGNFRSVIFWDKDHYNVSARNYKFELDTEIKRPFYFSTTVFFFEEPIGVKEIIAEGNGLTPPLKKIKDYYEVIINGNKNHYYYKDGIMEKAVMEFPVKNYVLKRKTN
jgi:hypothetical protein